MGVPISADRSIPFSPEPVWVRLSRFSLLLQCIFFSFAFLFLCVINRDYLFILQEYDLFLNSEAFFWQHFTYAGGPLDYFASFLAQFFLWPLLGGGLLVLLLFFIRKMTGKLFHFNGNGVLLSFVPAFLLIRIFVQPGPLVFADMQTNSLYSVFIGIFFTFCFAVCHSLFVSPILRCTWSSLGTILFYYLVGIYGLLGTLLCLFHECSFSREKRHFLCFVFPILCGISTPFLLFGLQLTKTSLGYAYCVGLPRGITREYNPLLFEYYILLGSILVLAVLQLVFNSETFKNFLKRRQYIREKQSNPRLRRSPSKEKTRFTDDVPMVLEKRIPRRLAVLYTILMILLCSATCVLSHARGDFLIVAKMCRLTSDKNWEEILLIRYENENPSLSIIVFRQLALFKLDRLADEAFAWPTTPHVNEGPWVWSLSNRVFGDHVLFEYGLVNMAFRTAMVQYSMKGSTISNLRGLAVSAIANEEYQLAEKYLHLIGQTTFYATWAKNHLDYIESQKIPGQAKIDSMSPVTREIEKQMNEIRQWMPVVNEIEKNEKIEDIIMMGFLRENIGEASGKVREMFLVQLLMTKGLTSFRKHYELWAEELYPERVPRCFQEALIMDTTMENIEARVEQYGFSPDLKWQFFDFMETLETTTRPGTPVETNSLIYQKYGDSFWYYFFLK